MFAPNLVTYTGYVVNQIEDGLKPGSGRTIIDYWSSIRLIRAAAIISIGSLELITVGLQFLLLIGPTMVRAVLEVCKLKSLCAGLPNVSFSSLGILAHKTLALAVQVIVGGPMMFWDPRQCIQLYDSLGLQRRVGRWSSQLGQLWFSVVSVYQMLHRMTGVTLSLVCLGGGIALHYPKASAALLAFFFIVSRRLMQKAVPQAALHSDPPTFSPPPTSPPVHQFTPDPQPIPQSALNPQPISLFTPDPSTRAEPEFEPVRNPVHQLVPERAPEPVLQSIPESTEPTPTFDSESKKEAEPTLEPIPQVHPGAEGKSSLGVEADPALNSEVEFTSQPDSRPIIKIIPLQTNESTIHNNLTDELSWEMNMQGYNNWTNKRGVQEQLKNDSYQGFPYVVSRVHTESFTVQLVSDDAIPKVRETMVNVSRKTWNQFVVATKKDNDGVLAESGWWTVMLFILRQSLYPKNPVSKPMRILRWVLLKSI